MDLKMLAGLSFLATFSLIFWRLLGKNFGKIQQGMRRFFLFLLIVCCIPPYMKFATSLKTILLDKFDLNYLLGQTLGDFKGTDWADGLLTAVLFFLYIAIASALWSKEKKESKKDDDKKEAQPFKIEARIGNIKEEVKKDEKK